MLPTSLVKAVLSVVGAVVLGAAALFGVRRRGTPPRAEPHPASEAPIPTPSKDLGKDPSKEPASGVLAILGSGGIVAVVALEGTLVGVIYSSKNLQDQLNSQQEIRKLELEVERTQRDDERVDTLYNHAIDQLSSGTPVLQVVGVHELGGVMRTSVQSERYDHTARDILASNLHVFAPSSVNGTGTPIAPPESSKATILAIVDVLGRQDPPIACPLSSWPPKAQRRQPR